MKLYQKFSLLLITTLFVTSCNLDFDDDDGGPFSCISGSGNNVVEEKNIATFSGIKLKIPADVYITEGSEQFVEIEGQQNVIDEIETDVKNGIWEIEYDDCVKNSAKVKIRITIPTIEMLHVSGSGSIYGENVITGGDIDLMVSGSGDMDLAVDVDDIEAKISGSGEIDLEGTGDEMEMKISGSGDLRAFDLIMNRIDLRVSGSGDAEVHVLDFLKVKINGSGDVFYKGFPSIDVDISGSGDLIDAN